MAFRDRILELRRVPAGELQADPRNWRRHPEAQRAALQSMLEDVGYADALIARETSGGLVLIDGHLRAGLDPEEVVPVLVLDVDEEEAGKLLATIDPLAAMAERDDDAWQELVESMSVSDRELVSFFRSTKPGSETDDDAVAVCSECGRPLPKGKT